MEKYADWGNPDLKRQMLYVFSYMRMLAFKLSICALQSEQSQRLGTQYGTSGEELMFQGKENKMQCYGETKGNLEQGCERRLKRGTQHQRSFEKPCENPLLQRYPKIHTCLKEIYMQSPNYRGDKSPTRHLNFTKYKEWATSY